jgi:hypothetical protein
MGEKEVLDHIHAANDAIQSWVNAHVQDVPEELLQLLTDLDWILNGP